jgi:hypothetical protein
MDNKVASSDRAQEKKERNGMVIACDKGRKNGEIERLGQFFLETKEEKLQKVEGRWKRRHRKGEKSVERFCKQ